MRQAQHTLEQRTRGRGLVEITREVVDWTRSQGIGAGLLTLYCRHTSASLLIQENADPDVRTDLERYFDRIAPDGPGTSTTPRGRTTCRRICAPR